MNRETENALLLLVGVSTAIITLSGAYTRYVKPSLQPWLLISAALLVVLALASILRDVRRGHQPDHAHDHGGHAHSSGTLWLLIVPIALLAFVVPPAIGPQTARPAVSEVSTDVLRRPFPPLPEGHAPEVSLPDLLIRIAQDSAGTLDGRLVTVTGFTMKDGGRVDLGRVVILCCAADAQLARIHLAGPALTSVSDLPDGSWVRLEGKVPAGQNDSARRSIPSLEITSARQVDAPENTYSY
ncbi:putative repeat protein (TIGR03943 family) [Mycolicibacterium iranicum]|uniref:Putative repeat protein (TIGR03943 family) n=1 Tax=Mycolicibacterium iranicum TaxID=912594 RepID=A0A839QFQ7_MYCIR|nr:TIGR03943 family protein [Mycolicibacterium iranicum]MBB2992072.1 putative repeat protein (TIGR03943 family) [Mycolicibacterium iranicum]